MNRRHLLGTVGAGFAAGLAGCLGGRTVTTPDGSDPAAGAEVRTDSTRVQSLRDADLPLSDSQLERGAAKDAIAAITNPAFGSDWSGVEPTLGDEEQVIGVEAGGAARAYPLAILNWHEVVNDTFGGPLLVTYCPLCGSGVTAVRRVNGQETVFGVSGKLWRSDLVLYDELTGSLWSQVLAKAVQGPKTGTPLALRPSALTTWGQWRAAHPETEVLLPPPESTTIRGEVVQPYDTYPYTGYKDNRRIGIGGSGDVDDRLHPKTRVLGVATDSAARAYPLPEVTTAGVVNDRVGDLPVVVTAVDNALYAYVRRVDGETLTFGRDGDTLTAGGSRWDPVSGTAVDGPHEGTQLRQANDRSPMFWFAWVDFFPDTSVYRADG